jgi:Sec-independent protein secretion pathway component TatC
MELLRAQVAEIDLLQLVPGFYLVLLFISLIVLTFFSTFFLKIPLDIDNKKAGGTKTTFRINSINNSKISFFLFSMSILVSLTTTIPLSLDSFNSYGEKTLENLWSIDEVLNLETILFTTLLSISQFPVVLLAGLTSEIVINSLPEYWKIISFVIFAVSGLLTPTIDGYTQLSFAFSAFALFFLIISILEKRLNLKLTGTLILA